MYCALCVLAGLQQTASKRRRVKNVQSRERSHFLPSPFGPCPQLNINTKKYKYRKKYKHKTRKGTIFPHSLQMWYWYEIIKVILVQCVYIFKLSNSLPGVGGGVWDPTKWLLFEFTSTFCQSSSPQMLNAKDQPRLNLNEVLLKLGKHFKCNPFILTPCTYIKSTSRI